MAKPATLDGYADKYTDDCERDARLLRQREVTDVIERLLKRIG